RALGSGRGGGLWPQRGGAARANSAPPPGAAAAAPGPPIALVAFASARRAGESGWDGPRHVQPEDRGRRMMGMRGCAVEDLGVEWIDAASSDANQDLASAWLRTQNVTYAEWCAVTLKNCGFHGATAHEVLPVYGAGA